MNIRVELETPARSNEIPAVLDFVHTSGLAEEGAGIWWQDAVPQPHRGFTILPKAPDAIDLDIVLAPVHRPVSVRDTRHARLFVGKIMPKGLDYFCLPVAGKQFQAPWLWSLLKEAQRLDRKVRLLYCEHGFVAHEIMRFADWFNLDSVKDTLRDWLDDDMKARFQDLFNAFPNTEIRVDVGNMIQLLGKEDPNRILVLGSLDKGYHPTGRYHGLNYSKLLSKTGYSAYFLAD